MKDSLLKQWQKTGIVKDKRLISAFKSIPREDFILPENLDEAYSDYPLPIGHDQTISQPTTIMIMIEALKLKPNDIVLEIGAGSGYNAALMSKLCKKVYSIEIIKELVLFARENIIKAGIKNVEIIKGDGSLGYQKEAPFDKIIITAACPKIPTPLIEQLKEGGIILAPVGESLGQKMVRGFKEKRKMEFEDLGYFSFVPLKGKHGF